MSNYIPRTQRLDHKVVELLPQLSRAFASKLIDAGKVGVNGTPERKAGYKLREHDEVTVDYDLTELEQIPTITLPILYEDADVVVIDKPIGLLSHSKGAYNPEATVATWLLDKWQGDTTDDRAGIAHRLDRATSGVMIGAKNPDALLWLQKQFSQRRLKKTYYAVIVGHMPHKHAVIDMPIERNPKHPQTFRTGPNGKTALTEYWVEQASDIYELLRLQPQTGRTHQLRVHLASLKHPIVGDTLYDGQPAERLYLHAARLELTLPSHERRIFEASLPTAFAVILGA